MRKLVLFALLLLSSFTYAQNFSYRFNGKLTETIVVQIENDLAANPSITNIKFKIKETSGELLFQYVKPQSTKEAQDDNSIVSIKSLLISKGLEPLELVELTK